MSKGAYIGAVKPEYEPVFENNTWSQIIKACQKNEIPITWLIGDQKKMTINGTDYPIDIIGKNHDDYADGSGKAPLTFQMHDCYNTAFKMNSTSTNSGGWGASEMRKTHLPSILTLMPSEVQADIKEVNKYTGPTSDKLFLLSQIEVTNRNDRTYAGEGTQYEYYAAGNSATKKRNGTAVVWWLRSPYKNNSTNFEQITDTGGDGLGVKANTESGVAFAFCFGGTSEINNTFGGYGVARKIKKGYVGIENTARKIKKAYIGIGGVARPCWSGGELAYYGAITPLSQGRYQLAATTVGNYALFGGGENSAGYHNIVDAYDTSLTRTTAANMSGSRYQLAATTVGNYALFGGGKKSSTNLSTVDAYDTSLAKTTPTALSQARSLLSATKVGNYALFGGGQTSNALNTVDAYNASLTRSSPTALSNARMRLTATAVGDYALFGGGYNNGYQATVDVYNSSLTKSTTTNLSVIRDTLAATTVGNYALFAGGQTGSGYNVSYVSTVDVYDSSLTKSTATDLSVARQYLSAATVGDFALFGGGTNGSGYAYVNTTDAYDKSLTRTTPATLSVRTTYLAATTVGNYALFGGGQQTTNGSSSSYSSVVDAYTVA